MVRVKRDFTGVRFGQLSVLGDDEAASSSRNRFVFVRCTCGVEKSVRLASLVNMTTVSCGCGKKYHSLKHGHNKIGRRSSEYCSWDMMIARCTNPKATAYEHYGGRGISVCERWMDSFENFLSDMGLKPSSKHSLERLDNSKGYEPGNCIWATPKEQSRNTRRNIFITIDGDRRCVQDWDGVFGVGSGTIRSRLRLGWDPVKAVTTPVKSRRG